MLIYLYPTTLHHIPKDNVYGHYHKNLIFTRTKISTNNLDLLFMGVLIVQFIIIIIIIIIIILKFFSPIRY